VELLQFFACWADVAIILAIPGEVRTREGPVRPVRFIKHWNVRRDVLFLNQPSEIVGRTISTIGGQIAWLQSEAALGSVNHRA
jgi:hypothetical protein